MKSSSANDDKLQVETLEPIKEHSEISQLHVRPLFQVTLHAAATELIDGFNNPRSGTYRQEEENKTTVKKACECILTFVSGYSNLNFNDNVEFLKSIIVGISEKRMC